MPEETTQQGVFRSVQQARKALHTYMDTDLACITDEGIRVYFRAKLAVIDFEMGQQLEEMRYALLADGYQQRITQYGLIVIEGAK